MCRRDVGAGNMVSVLCFEILFTEAGRAGFLIMLEGSITIILVATVCHDNHHKAGTCGEYRIEVHPVVVTNEVFVGGKCALSSRSMKVPQEKDRTGKRHQHGLLYSLWGAE